LFEEKELEGIPFENLSAYTYMYLIEVSLREFLIKHLDEAGGPKYYKQLLPNDVYGKFKEGRNCEKKSPWVQTIPHHPLYYIDFPDLEKIIAKNDNWNGLFKQELKNRDQISVTLKSIELIRNKVAHNRLITKADVTILDATLQKIITFLGGRKLFDELLKRSEVRISMHKLLENLYNESKAILDKVRQLEEVVLFVWLNVKSSWWYDPDYLCEDVSSITMYFETIEKYSKIDRGRGQGHKIERWFKDSGIEALYEASERTFVRLLKEAKDA